MSVPPSTIGATANPPATQPDQISDEGEYSDSESHSRGGTFAGASNGDLDDWSDGGEDEEEQDEPATCLFCTSVITGLTPLKEHLSAAHSFDFRASAAKLGLDFYQQMKLINYIRERRSQNESADELVKRITATGAQSDAALAFLFNGSESYLKPFLADDSLLFSLPRQTNAETGDADEDEEEAKAADATTQAPSINTLMQENQSLRNELESMQEAMRTMQTTLKRVAFADEDNSDDAPPALATAAASSSVAAAPAKQPKAVDPTQAPGSFAPEHVDRDYFGGYSTRNIHELMLRDTIRTEAYRDFMYKSGLLFKDKVVLDVGCGTGILSMFAAKMGAKMVIGVDAADIVHKAREIISANGFSNVITVLHGKMEEVVLPVDKVDIIISEWMGYFLLFESMLPSVLFARDRYLREVPSTAQPIERATGVYPNLAIMYVAGIETAAATRNRIDWWKDVYGFNMDCLVEEREKFQSSTVEIIRPDQVITSVAVLKEIDVQTCKDGDLDFEQEFVLSINSGKELFTGFMVYFDTLFSFHTENVINLSTAPIADRAPEPELTTHWMQSVFYLAKPLKVNEGDSIKAKLKAKR